MAASGDARSRVAEPAGAGAVHLGVTAVGGAVPDGPREGALVAAKFRVLPVMGLIISLGKAQRHPLAHTLREEYMTD